MISNETSITAINNISCVTLGSAMRASSANCDESLWGHVYHSWRLQVVDPCVTVSGIIDSINKREADGDYHIRLHLDEQFTNLLTQGNVNSQLGDLVVETICQHTPRSTFTAAVGACNSFNQKISVPPVGTHVTVTGTYVLETNHGGWAEIHPASSLRPG